MDAAERLSINPMQLFSLYMQLTGAPTLTPVSDPNAQLKGKKLGVVNGSSWISLWSTYFGTKTLPGVKIINTGNEAIQLHFMEAYHHGLAVPPQINIDLLGRYAQELYDLYRVDAILISCSTMNRAFAQVKSIMAPLGVPVVQIDEAMMEIAVQYNGKILVVATHGPTVLSTQALLQETADRLGQQVQLVGVTIEAAFDLLGQGKIEAHNELIAKVIRQVQAREAIDIVVLAQLSMSVFSFSYPDPLLHFGIPVLNSGETGFAQVGAVLKAQEKDSAHIDSCEQRINL